jgi:hypothetical protein
LFCIELLVFEPETKPEQKFSWYISMYQNGDSMYQNGFAPNPNDEVFY